MKTDPLVAYYLNNHPASAAGILHQLEIPDLCDFLASLPADTASGLLPYLTPVTAAEALTRLELPFAAEILAKMPNEAAVLIMRSMKRDQHRDYYQEMPRAAALRLRMQMRYPEALVGSLVDSEVITLQPDHRVVDALRLIRTGKSRVSQQIYIVDNARRLRGYIDLTTLVSNRERIPIARIRKKVPLTLNTRAPLHVVDDLEAWLDFDNLPVVDRTGNFQGILRREAIFREDHSLLQSISPEREFSRTSGALTNIFWLAIGSLLGTGQSQKSLKHKGK